jgi:hypothetical protein
MYHYYEALINPKGGTFAGFYGRVIDPATQAVVSIYSDDSGTPISTISGVADMVKTDVSGNASFYVEPGRYHFDIYSTDSITFLFRYQYVGMGESELLDTVSVTDYGAIPNNATDTTVALASAINDGAVRIRFPYRLGEDGTYKLASAWQADGSMDDVTIDVDPATTISHAASSDVQSLAGGMVRYERPTRHLLRDINSEYWSYPESNPVGNAKYLFLAGNDLDHSAWQSVTANDSAIVQPLYVAWNGSDSWVADTFTSSTPDSFTRAVALTDGFYHMGFTRVLPGQRYFAIPQVNTGTPLIAAIVRHEGGFSGVSAETDSSPAINRITKLTGVAGTSDALGFTGFPAGTHASYQPQYSGWAIEIETWNTYSIYYNGVLVDRVTVPGIISDAGFGMYANANADSITWGQHVLGKDLPRSSGQFLSVLSSGDSRGMPRDGCWVDYARQALDLSLGVRCYKWDNIAVGGDDSTAQLAALTATSLGSYNHVHINIGTNDAQGLGSLPTFLSNITAMKAYVVGNGCSVSFSIFDLWYTQGQAGAGEGQASANYQLAAPYREVIRRYCADNGIKLLDETLLSGPVVANYVNASLSPNLVGQGDPWQFDNIHQTSLANRIRGQAIAYAILGTRFPKRTLELASQGLTPQNGWTATIEQPTLQISANGTVWLSGVINDTGGATHTDGTVIATLPAYVRRSRVLRFRVVSQNAAENGFINLDLSTGEMSIYGFPTSTYVDLSAIQFPLTA